MGTTTDGSTTIFTVPADHAGREHEVVVSKSRFICALERTSTEAEAREFIADRRRMHHDATHNCTAYVLGDDGETARSSDDGEPPGTAGVPMLDVLRRRRVTNTVAVVTRYFGGVKLGAGGLVRAYGGAVAAALDAVGIMQLVRMSIVTVVADYDVAGRLEADLRGGDWRLIDVRFGDAFSADVAVADADDFIAWLASRTAGAAVATVTGSTVIELPG